MVKSAVKAWGIDMELKIIARIYTDFNEKFGIPRQSGIAKTRAKIVFEKEYRVPEALRGISEYSHLWLIWQFSELKRRGWTPTVRPPRLGGNKRVGVFATRSPYRPNPIGLSSVRLIRTEHNDEDGDILIVEGADILNGTPIYDIKPYLKFTDSHDDAISGFADSVLANTLSAYFPPRLLNLIPEDRREALIHILENDPRPGYKDDGCEIYGMNYAGYEISFKISDGIVTVTDVKFDCAD